MGHPIDAFGDGAALLTAVGLVVLVVQAWRAAVFVQREEGSVRDWQEHQRALAHAVGRD